MEIMNYGFLKFHLEIEVSEKEDKSVPSEKSSISKVATKKQHKQLLD